MINVDNLIAETMERENLVERIEKITGYTLSGNAVVAPDMTRTPLTKISPNKLVYSYLTSGQKRTFRRVMNQFDKIKLSGLNYERKELYFVVGVKLYMLKFIESKTGNSIRHVLFIGEPKGNQYQFNRISV
ncbi:hypothetical protein ACA877_000233 [Vibrio alginolyticus]|uniref:hypothetical protein n=1 Tax=Vibrio TaxID=662 RepID=UPI00280892EC|nr:hypothetical protein [Vibrio sp. Vb2704]EJL6721267.1 hypothetical protein [Vibrio alginolyticus]ELA8074867.1 hypothetical protein [Vibrio alginolyticus]MDW1624514.1 hypothetical protein [Vibrio sp. Vb2704]